MMQGKFDNTFFISVKQIQKKYSQKIQYFLQSLMSIQQAVPVVIDNGSGMCKAGYSGDDMPRFSCPSITGRPKYQYVMGRQRKNFYLGEQALGMKGVLKLSYPMEHGRVANWDDMKEIWKYCYNSLDAKPQSQPILLTEAAKTCKASREKMADIIFNQFKAPSLYLAIQPVLSLYGGGRTTGLVVDCGDGVTQAVAVYYGDPIHHTVERKDFGGKDLTQYTGRLLNEVGTSSMRDIKEKLCYVAQDYEAEIASYKSSSQNNKTYELPDGNEVSLSSQRIICPEALFKPYIIGKQMPGLHQIAYQSILKSDIDIHRDLYSNIVLCGGSTLFPGTPERLLKQTTALAPSNARVKVIAPAERKYTTWIGGSILSSLSTFKTMWITKAQYQESGPTIIHRKCF